MGLQDFFTWRAQSNTPSMDEEVPADVDEPPDPRLSQDLHIRHPDFHKATIRPINDRKESLLTRALTKHENEDSKPPVHVTTDLTRRRSMLSNASLASTAELTSDGGLTSPARTNTPSPPPPSTLTTFAPYSFAQKPIHPPEPLIAKVESNSGTSQPPSISPKSQQLVFVEAPKAQIPAAEPKKRCISFACGGTTSKPKPKPTPIVELEQALPAVVAPPKKRACKISFACAAPKPSQQEKPKDNETDVKNVSTKDSQTLKSTAQTPRRISRSPVAMKKSPRSTQPSRLHRDSNSTVRQTSQSPVSTRVKPRYIIADEKTLQDSEATRFCEFSTGKLQEDDWIRRDEENPRARLTINDTLQKENAIRRLGNEAEEEALEDEENEGEEEEEDEDDENEEEDDDEDGSDDEFSDGNETDNEAGFAESDESEGEGEFASFWNPGGRSHNRELDGASTYRPSAHRTASASSIDSLGHMSPPKTNKLRRLPKQRPIKIRPGTPDLPDSTDFVCGTLDEDRPLEVAYVSCMEARKNAKHKQCPQDIDPSFPTSDIDDEEDDEDLVNTARSSDENIWTHGKFEESDGERQGRRGSRNTRRKSPLHSPPPPGKRLHSPPPKTRLRSPPPRRLFGGHSPRRFNSPPPARHVASPAASPTSHNATSMAIPFVPLGSRPGLTHTKSLPRTPNVFCRQYRAARLAAANGNDGCDDADGHIRGAIDIVKGLEQKRQRRKEKFHQKQGKGKVHTERRPQPGKGAERMRELGLLMAGKNGHTDPYILSA